MIILSAGHVPTAVEHARLWAKSLAKEMGQGEQTLAQMKTKNEDLIQKIQDLHESNDEIQATLQDLIKQGSDIDDSIANGYDIAQLEFRALSNALTIRCQSQSQDSARQASMSY